MEFIDSFCVESCSKEPLLRRFLRLPGGCTARHRRCGDHRRRVRADAAVQRLKGLGFSTSQDFNGDIALIACFASSWTPAMVRRWHADPFGFLRPWNELPVLMASAPPATPRSTGTSVVTCLMG